MAEPVQPWFAAKRHGYGAGLPIRWQGWLVLGAYLVGTIAAPLLLFPSRTPPLALTLMLAWTGALTAALVAVCRRRTAGGWRWRR